MPARRLVDRSPLLPGASPLPRSREIVVTLTESFAHAKVAFLQELTAEVRLGSKSHNTLRTYEGCLDFFERSVPVSNLNQVNRTVVMDFLTGVKEGTLPDSRHPGMDSYVERQWRHLKAFLKWCRKRGYPVDPELWEFDGERDCFAVKRPYVEEQDHDLYIWQPDEVEVIRAAASSVGRREQLVVELLLRAGLRPGELIRLELDDVLDEDGNVREALRVRNSKSRRGGVKVLRWVGLHSELRRMIAAYIEKYRPASPHSQLILSQSGQPLALWGLRSLLVRLHARAGVSGSAYTYRHTFGSQYLRHNPGKVVKLKEIMGHKDIQTTLRYAQHGKADLAANIEDEDPFAWTRP